MFATIFPILAFLTYCGKASETITLYSVMIEERPPGNPQPTELESISTISVSAILNVDGIVTEYAISEVITQIVEENIVGTQTIPSTVLTTPITVSYTIDQGTSFWGNTISQLIPFVLSPGAPSTIVTTALATGELGCSVTSFPGASGTQVACAAVESINASSPFPTGATTFFFAGELSPIFTLTEATTPILPSGTSGFIFPSGVPLSNFPSFTPSSTTLTPSSSTPTVSTPTPTTSTSSSNSKPRYSFFLQGFAWAIIISVSSLLLL